MTLKKIVSQRTLQFPECIHEEITLNALSAATYVVDMDVLKTQLANRNMQTYNYHGELFEVIKIGNEGRIILGRLEPGKWFVASVLHSPKVHSVETYYNELHPKQAEAVARYAELKQAAIEDEPKRVPRETKPTYPEKQKAVATYSEIPTIPKFSYGKTLTAQHFESAIAYQLGKAGTLDPSEIFHQLLKNSNQLLSETDVTCRVYIDLLKESIKIACEKLRVTQAKKDISSIQYNGQFLFNYESDLTLNLDLFKAASFDHKDFEEWFRSAHLSETLGRIDLGMIESKIKGLLYEKRTLDKKDDLYRSAQQCSTEAAAHDILAQSKKDFPDDIVFLKNILKILLGKKSLSLTFSAQDLQFWMRHVDPGNKKTPSPELNQMALANRTDAIFSLSKDHLGMILGEILKLPASDYIDIATQLLSEQPASSLIKEISSKMVQAILKDPSICTPAFCEKAIVASEQDYISVEKCEYRQLNPYQAVWNFYLLEKSTHTNPSKILSPSEKLELPVVVKAMTRNMANKIHYRYLLTIVNRAAQKSDETDQALFSLIKKIVEKRIGTTGMMQDILPRHLLVLFFSLMVAVSLGIYLLSNPADKTNPKQ